jgi:hypothetical protein
MIYFWRIFQADDLNMADAGLYFMEQMILLGDTIESNLASGLL